MKEYETLVASATPLAPDVFWRAIESETQKLRLPVAQRARLNPTVLSCTLSRNRNLYAGIDYGNRSDAGVLVVFLAEESSTGRIYKLLDIRR